MLEHLSKFYGDKVYTKPNIPQNKLYNFVSVIGFAIKPEEVLVLVDDTLFGSAKEGMAFTNNMLYIKGSGGIKMFELAKSHPFMVIKQTLSVTIFSQNMEIASLTQPDYDVLFRFFNDLNAYLSKINSTNLQNSPQNVANHASQNTQNIQNTTQDIIKKADDDLLIDQINNMLKCCCLLDIFKQNAPEINPFCDELKLAKTLEQNAKKNIINLTNYLREKIKQSNANYLQNDFSTFEIIVFSANFTKFAMQEYYDEKIVTNTIYNALCSIFGVDKMCDFIMQIVFSCENLQKSIVDFYLRLLISNKKENIFYENYADILRNDYADIFADFINEGKDLIFTRLCAKTISEGSFAFEIEEIAKIFDEIFNTQNTFSNQKLDVGAENIFKAD